MKKLAVVGMGCLVLVGNASAGVVVFNNGADLVVNRTTDSLTPSILVAVNPDAPAFDAAIVLAGSDTVPITGFEYLPSWTGPGGFTVAETPIIDGQGIYAYGAYFGGNISPGQVTADTIVSGNLSVDLSGLADGTYEIVVNSATDFDTSGVGSRGVLEPLTGRLGITIVPEPATLSLLGLGLAAALRRRRSA